ncbi:unnamed protein product [Polarella glacialis]|nr:unnamed protein product [Polarella glacialis]
MEPAPPHQGKSAVLAATCDAYGRVGLFCLETLRCLHLWKGYRDAQVAWLHVDEDRCEAPDVSSEDEARPETSSERRLGLVIYAPRRGLLELWSLGGPGLEGPKRAAAASVGCGCRLLASPDGRAHLLGSCGQLDRVVWPPIVADVATPSPATRSGAGTPGAALGGAAEPDDSDAFDSAGSEDEDAAGRQKQGGGENETEEKTGGEDEGKTGHTADQTEKQNPHPAASPESLDT